ncbi:efflux RND transporter permease subunit [Acidisphaera rubrifaciens]|uniref:Efflux pump membrane transporter n=1 Tax=Acidisphaera rubrifaciens HS-AP3 TaxID=1231350 RepID=A0A0D6P4N3_9PROT|nr:efflux RND transporter permease subunit [Acidisphaera rubrifaciens]GAN75854.1 multidrug resistance efflux pump acriflavin resistance protein AcrB/AcrD/AcrF [Acidisphaera rubrifaciens HS-AP3]
MISRFFIDRPVLANVLAILFVLIGGVALFSLPVSQYPNVTPPTVQVTTRYPGASAVTVMNTVALPIEEQVNGVDGMIYMQSTSAADGTYALTVSFRIGTDPNLAQILVQNRVASAMASLPTPVQAQGVTTQKKSTSILQIVTLTSSDPRYDSLFLSNYATINLVDELSRLPGVGNVNVFGVGQYAMRVWLDPQKLLVRDLTPGDVIAAIQQQSQQVAGGQLGTPPTPPGQAFQYTIDVQGRLTDPKQFAAIVVKSRDGAVTRISDIGRVELGAQTYSQAFQLNGKPAAGVSIYQTPGANALQVAGEVKATMDRLARAFPAGIAYTVPFDSTLFVTASIDEVYMTLLEAAVLVLVVILMFLQDWRAMLVPATTVPVTIIGTFAVMSALGFSVNLSTLFAIVLAIGIVVDDAIVVVEGAAHHLERGLSPHDAAIRAMDELLGPIIGITLVLMSVFIPAAFLPGLTGQMYAQFALVIAATALISAINAATLKPTQCALWLRAPVPPEKRNFIFRGFNRLYDPVDRGFGRLIGGMTRRAPLVVFVGLILVVLGGLGIGRLPTAFIPTEDQGYVVVALQLPQGASLERTQAALDRVGRIAGAIPGVDQVIEIAGVSPLDNNASLASAGAAYVMLKDWGVREKAGGQGLRQIYATLQAAMDKLPDGAGLVLVPPPIQGIGNASGFTMELELRDGNIDWQKLQGITSTVLRDAAGQSGLQHVGTSYQAAAPQIRVEVDRTKAETFHVAVGDVFNALAGYIGSSYVNQFNEFGRTFQVYVQADSHFRLRPSDLDRLYVRSRDGKMVPLGALVLERQTAGPSLVTLYNLRPAATVVGVPARGFSSGQAMGLMEQIADSVLPTGTGYDWTAMSYQEKAVGGQIYLVFGLAMLLVYLCLAGQYESWIAPLSVLLAVPLSLIGPAIVLESVGLANNLYTQIGMVLLIALSAKNAILIVEVAREHRAAGAPILDAAVGAARARFRPILMTSFAFILGVLPLVTATGAGAAARVSLGMTVFSGMTASTCLTVLFVPSFFVMLQRLEERLSGRARPTVAEQPSA